MGATLASRTQEAKIIQRLAELEQTVEELRTNQAQKLTFAGLTLDGTGATGLMTAGTGNVVDSGGLVSLVNFPKSQIFNGSAGLSTGSTSLVDVTGGTIGTITTDRSIQVVVYVMGFGHNTGFITSNGTNQTNLIVYDSFSSGSIINVLIPGAATTYTPDGIAFTMTTSDEMRQQLSVLQMAAGTHNLKLQYQAENGGTAILNAFLAGYIVLGN